MSDHEARLHAMLANAGGSWPLNEVERAAIRWLMDHAIKLDDSLQRANREYLEAQKQIVAMRTAAEKASAEFMRVAVRQPESTP